MDKVELIDLDAREVVMEGGRVLPIANMFDSSGEDCDADEAAVIIAGVQGYGFLTIELEEGPTIH